MPVTLAINVDTGGWKLGGLHVMFRDGMKVLGVRRIQVEGRLILLESRVPPTLGLVCARMVSVWGTEGHAVSCTETPCRWHG